MYDFLLMSDIFSEHSRCSIFRADVEFLEPVCSPFTKRLGSDNIFLTVPKICALAQILSWIVGRNMGWWLKPITCNKVLSHRRLSMKC